MIAATTLSSRERVNRMFARQHHDRVPRHESFWTETVERWQHEGLRGDGGTVLALLDGDFAGICWNCPSAYSGDVVLEENEQTVVRRDIHGGVARWWKHRMGTPEHLCFECDSREKWETQFKPMLLAREPVMDLATVRRLYDRARRANKWVYFAGNESFEQARAMIGDEVSLMAMAEDPDWIVDISRTFTDCTIAEYQRLLDAGIRPDGLWTYGDMAFNHATVCSPTMYRELIWPDHKRLADFAHRQGMKFIYHTDGNVRGVLDLYVDAGFDCLQPLEAKAGMDVRELAPVWGDRLALFGNIDVMVMATNNRDRIEAEVRSKLEAGKLVRSYVYHSDHSVPPSVAWDTYQFVIKCVERYGGYD